MTIQAQYETCKEAEITRPDTLGVEVDRPVVTETTALGAAYLAGLQAGLFKSLDEISSHWQRDRHFRPVLDEPTRQARYAGWRRAVERVCSAPE